MFIGVSSKRLASLKVLAREELLMCLMLLCH